jgi:hypothetical protein
MIAGHFDRQTMAAMELALDRACERWPDGGKHKLRKRVAQSIIRCAKTGKSSLDALTEAGDRAAAQPPPRRPVRLRGTDVIRPDYRSAT